jgi:Ca-activated chloride channel family protein
MDQSAGAGDQSEDTGNAFTQLMDQMLGNGGEQPQEAGNPTASGQAMATLNQAAEQQLRRVPDDPSGLLRARIRQHYDSLRAGQN